MKKSANTLMGPLFLIFAIVPLTGCDLLQSLGIGPKKQSADNQITAAPVQTVAPAPAAPAAPGPMPANALVRIGNWTLTQEDFNNRLTLLKQQLPDFKEDDANAKNAVLDELIRQQLLVQEAQDSGVGDTKDIKDAVDDFRKTLLVQEMASRLTKDVVATEEDARAYYDANKDKFTKPVKWDVSEIVLPDEATAKNVLVQVLQGGDFAQLAQTQSKAADAAQGGKVAPFAAGHAPFTAMQDAISSLDVGGTSGVFKGPDGFYIIKVNAKTGGDLATFESVKKNLIYGLTMQKQQAVLLNHLGDLAQKQKPEYNKDLIDQVVGKPTQQQQ